MTIKYKNLAKHVSIAMLSSVLLSSCSFMDDDKPPRYNTILGGKRAPALNPSGSNFKGYSTEIVPAEEQALHMSKNRQLKKMAKRARPQPTAMVEAKHEMSAAATQPVKQPMKQSMATIADESQFPAELPDRGLESSHLTSPNPDMFIDDATAQVLGQPIGIVSAAPVVPVSTNAKTENGFIPLADVPEAPQSMAKSHEAAKGNIVAMENERSISANESQAIADSGIVVEEIEAGSPVEEVADFSADTILPWGGPSEEITAPAQETTKVTNIRKVPVEQATAPTQTETFPEALTDDGKGYKMSGAGEWTTTEPIIEQPIQKAAIVTPVVEQPIAVVEAFEPVADFDADKVFSGEENIKLTPAKEFLKERRLLPESRYTKRYRDMRIKRKSLALSNK